VRAAAVAAAATSPLLSWHSQRRHVLCSGFRPPASPDLSGADIPSAYKTHFTQAYDAQAAKGGEGANVAKRHAHREGDVEVRTAIAQTLMERLGYTKEELELVGEYDVLKMQGVGSPFPLARIEHGDKVLDLGSGFGVDAFLAAEKAGPSGEVVGIDLSQEEVHRACARAEERNLQGRCSFLKADMEQLPFPDATFDVVISNGGFCLVPDKERAFNEIFRVLKPGGRFAVACTVLRKELPPLAAPKTWPLCMIVFLQAGAAPALVESCGFQGVLVDDANSAMDVWTLDADELMNVSKLMPPSSKAEGRGCSHARKAAEQRAKERIDDFIHRDREGGVHWGNPEFDHLQEFDMNNLCARVVITAEKPSQD